MWTEADIVNTTLASTGLLVAIVGLAAVYWQIRKVRGAAEAAQSAATTSREVMARRVTAADLGSTRVALRALRGELRSGGVEHALLSCDLIRESLVALHARNTGRISEERRDALDDAVATVRSIQQELEQARAGSEPFDASEVYSMVADLIDFVVDWQESPLSLEGERDDDQRDA